MKDSLFIVAAFIAALPIAGGATWTPVNNGLPAQTPGISAVVPDPNDPDTAYALTTHGSMYKTTDAASTWRAVRGVGVNSLAVDPIDSSIIYAATTHGIAKSVDGGSSWAAANGGLDATTLNAYGLVIDPVNPSTLYAIDLGNGNRGNGWSILKTNDGAATWSAVYTFANSSVPAPLTIDPVTPSTLYTAVSGGAILKSTDGAQSWSQIKPAPGRVGVAPDAMTLAMDPGNSFIVYAGSFANPNPQVSPNQAGAGAIVKSADGGQTWRTISTGIPADAFVRKLVVDPSAPLTLYAAYLGNTSAGIVKSIDAGESWSVVYTISNAVATVGIGPGRVYAAYAGGSGGGILQSVDGGSTWNPAHTGLEYFDLHVLATDPVHPGVLFVGGVGGLFKRAEAETSWTTLNLPPIATAAESLFQVPASDSLVRSLAIDFTNPDVLYVNGGRANGCVYDDQVLLKTIDGGASWSNSISPPLSGCLLGGYFTTAPMPVLVMDPSDSQSLYLAEGEDEDGGYVLLKSTDGGASWNGIWDFRNGLESGLNALVIDRSNPATLYAGIGDASPGLSRSAIGFFKSTDGGATWSNMGLTDAAVTVLVPDPFDSSTLYAATQGIYTSPRGFRGIFRTIDGGITWSAINNGLDRLTQVGAVVAAMAVDPGNPGTMYAATSGDGVYNTIDGATTWAPFNEGLSSFDIRALALAADGVYAATAAGVFRAPRETRKSGTAPIGRLRR